MKMSKDAFLAMLQGMFDNVISKVKVDSSMKMNLMRLVPLWKSANYKIFEAVDSDIVKYHNTVGASNALVEMMYAKELLETKTSEELISKYQDLFWFRLMGIQR